MKFIGKIFFYLGLSGGIGTLILLIFDLTPWLWEFIKNTFPSILWLVEFLLLSILGLALEDKG